MKKLLAGLMLLASAQAYGLGTGGGMVSASPSAAVDGTAIAPLSVTASTITSTGSGDRCLAAGTTFYVDCAAGLVRVGGARGVEVASGAVVLNGTGAVLGIGIVPATGNALDINNGNARIRNTIGSQPKIILGVNDLASADAVIKNVSGDIIIDGGTTTGILTLKNSNGNVGIGTSAPEQALHVSGRAYVDRAENYAIGIGRGVGLDKYFLGVHANTTPDLLFSNNAGDEKLRLTYTGNVGIGTASPGTKLHMSSGTLTVDGTGGALNLNSDSTFPIKLNGSTKLTLGSGVQTNGLLTFNDISNNFERGRMTDAGDWGLGTLAPATKLDVNGNAQFGSGVKKATFTVSGGLDLPYGVSAATAAITYVQASSVTINGAPIRNADTSGSISFGGDSAGNPGVKTGTDNMAFGQSAGKLITSGTSNMLFGLRAGQTITTQSENSFFGANSGEGGAGGFNSGFGFRSLSGVLSGDFLVAAGYRAGQGVTTGGESVFVGAASGLTAGGGDAVTTSSRMTFVGRETGLAGVTQLTGSGAFGYRAVVGCSDCYSYGIGTSKHGFGTPTPATTVDINGNFQWGSGATKSTGAANGDLNISGSLLFDGVVAQSTRTVGIAGGALTANLTSGVTFYAFTVPSAITLRTLTAVVQVAGIGAGADVIRCNDAAGTGIQVSITGAAAAGTITDELGGSANIATQTRVNCHIESANATKPNVSITLGYVTQ